MSTTQDPAAAGARAARVRLYLLGAFRLEPATRLPTRKVEALLAYLALHPGPHAREKLAALLWGDSPDELARGSLRKALTLLRGRLGDELLLADRETVQLNPGYGLWVDARALRDQAAPLAAGAPGGELDLELYAGDLLADLYDDWIAPLREALRDLFLAAAARLAGRAYEGCDYEGAIDAAARVLRHDPANEDAHRILMVSYAATGRRAAALEQFARCRRSLAQELDVPPGPATVAVYERIKAEQAVAPAPAPLNNLPRPLTSFVGRVDTLAGIREALRSSRLVTLTGAGGCGKSRTAIQAAAAAAPEYADGVAWLDLSALADPALVPQALARTLGLPDVAIPAGEATGPLANYLGPRRLLLVIDNCEHLVLAVARLAAALLAACPRLTILATSREPLGIAGEVVRPVPPLALPGDQTAAPPAGAALDENESVRLFQERARAVAPHFLLTEQNAAAVCAICRALDGLPLAIELAAARVRVLSPAQIAERLADRFALLTGGDRLAQPRQQTLRAAIDWSYNLLGEPERAMLRCLSVFAGGFTLEAAEALWDAGGEVSALELLSRLIDKSLVTVEAEGPGVGVPPRYRLLETIRAYAAARLAGAGETEAARRRHLAYCCRLAEQNGDAWYGPRQAALAGMMDRELDNYRAALAFGLEDDPMLALRAAAALGFYWTRRALPGEGHFWLAAAVERVEALPGGLEEPAAASAYAWAYVWLGGAAMGQGDDPAAGRYYGRGAALAERSGDAAARAFALSMLGLTEHRRGDREPAQAHLEEGVRLARAEDAGCMLPAALGTLAGFWFDMGEPDRGLACAEEALAAAALRGNRWFAGMIHVQLARAAVTAGQQAAGAAHMHEALAIFTEMGDRLFTNVALSSLADSARLDGDRPRARLLYRQVLLAWRDLGRAGALARCAECLAFVAEAEGCAAAGHDVIDEALTVPASAADPAGSLVDAGARDRAGALWLHAVRLLSGAAALRQGQAAAMALDEVAEHRGHVEALQAALGAELFTETWRAAQSLTYEQLINLALRDL